MSLVYAVMLGATLVLLGVGVTWLVLAPGRKDAREGGEAKGGGPLPEDEAPPDLNRKQPDPDRDVAGVLAPSLRGSREAAGVARRFVGRWRHVAADGAVREVEYRADGAFADTTRPPALDGPTTALAGTWRLVAAGDALSGRVEHALAGKADAVPFRFRTPPGRADDRGGRLGLGSGEAAPVFERIYDPAETLQAAKVLSPELRGAAAEGLAQRLVGEWLVPGPRGGRRRLVFRADGFYVSGHDGGESRSGKWALTAAEGEGGRLALTPAADKAGQPATFRLERDAAGRDVLHLSLGEERLALRRDG